MRIEPDGVLKRLVRGMPAGTMGGTRRSDPIRERAAATPTIITPADTISVGGGGIDGILRANFDYEFANGDDEAIVTPIRARMIGGGFEISGSVVSFTVPGVYAASISGHTLGAGPYGDWYRVQHSAGENQVFLPAGVSTNLQHGQGVPLGVLMSTFNTTLDTECIVEVWRESTGTGFDNGSFTLTVLRLRADSPASSEVPIS